MPTGIYIRTEKHRIAISAGLKGHTTSEETKRKIREAHKGMKHTPEALEKISKAVSARGYAGKGNPFYGRKHSEETKKIIKEKRAKQVITEAHRRAIANGHKGEKSHLWQGGITPLNLRARNCIEYKLWRESVFKRDEYTCKECDAHSGNGKAVYLTADHIKPFALFPELRYAIDNGLTLCWECHKKTPTFGGRTRQKITSLTSLS